MKGLLFDPEPYTPPHSQFSYAAQPGRTQHGFNEYAAKARQRGRQVMRAVAEEYPEITLFCYFMNSVCATATGRADPRPALAAQGYGLYPAMIDGWLDAAPPTVALVDGCESAYRYNSRQQFLESAMQIKGACQELVSPENRAKYRAQVQVSFGMYLDAYWNPKDSPWYIDGLGGPRVERLRANTSAALAAADEYVWVYGERFRWWPTPNQGVRPETWPEALPGSEQALRYARDPLDFARTEMARMKAGRKAGEPGPQRRFQLVHGQVDGRRRAEMARWQPARRLECMAEGRLEGDLHLGPGSWGCGQGCGPGQPRCGRLLSPVVSRWLAGERYAVRAACKVHGNGNAWLRVRWQTAEGRWTAETQDQLFYCEASPDNWRELFGVVEVPEGVGRLLILLGVGGQSTAEDVVWFDDVELYKLAVE